MAIKVQLRKKKISQSRLSLYLDFYPAIPHPETGKPTRREFLGHYLFEKPKEPADKKHNKETLTLAENIKQIRYNQLNKPEIYAGYEKEQLRIKERSQQDFITYFKTLSDKRKSSNHDNWVSAYNYLIAFTNGKLKFADLNERFCSDFKEYLLTTKSLKRTKTSLAQNSAVSYFNKVKAAMKQAHKDGYLPSDLNRSIAPIKQLETRRNFLTIEELNSLIKTECNNPLLKRAALFSALTGMRFSDIKKLVWQEIEFVKKEGHVIRFTQKKTNSVEDHPIDEQAFSLLGERKEPNAQVFKGLTYSAYENRHLYQWIGAAGITKDITFHCFRHTYATLQISNGTDIYTLSKLLGHRELKSTQIYAKIVDEMKRKAAGKIKLKMNG